MTDDSCSGNTLRPRRGRETRPRRAEQNFYFPGRDARANPCTPSRYPTQLFISRTCIIVVYYPDLGTFNLHHFRFAPPPPRGSSPSGPSVPSSTFGSEFWQFFIRLSFFREKLRDISGHRVSYSSSTSDRRECRPIKVNGQLLDGSFRRPQ